MIERAAGHPMERRSTRRQNGRRVGMIVPSVNAVVEPDFAWISPEGITFHTTRIPLFATTPEGLREMNRSVEAAAGLLAHLSPDLIVFACTSGSFVDGEEGLQRQIDLIGQIGKCPVVATSRAIIQSCRELGIDRIDVATPYLDSVNEFERTFFEGHGLEVTSLVGLGLSGPAIREVPPDDIVALARRANTSEGQGMFLSCTDLRALEVVDRLEAEFGKPVLTSNQVTMWAILKALGDPVQYPGFGRILAQ